MGINVESARYVRMSDFVTRRIADEVILVPFRGKAADLSNLFQLNEVATFVWNELETPRSIDDLVHRVVGEFEVAEAEARKDVTEFVEGLEKVALIRSEKSSA